MSTALLGLILGLIGAAVTGTVTWLIARRTSSGTVATSDATTLWEASNQIRQDLSKELSDTRGKVDQLEGKVDLLTSQNETLRQQHQNCAQREAALRERVEMLEAAVERRVVRKQTPRRRS